MITFYLRYDTLQIFTQVGREEVRLPPLRSLLVIMLAVHQELPVLSLFLDESLKPDARAVQSTSNGCVCIGVAAALDDAPSEVCEGGGCKRLFTTPERAKVFRMRNTPDEASGFCAEPILCCDH